MIHRKFPWEGTKRYNDYSAWFRSRFKGKVQKISLDAGFTCPNRDGSRGTGGCTYCNNKSFNPDYCRTEKEITAQLAKGVGFFAAKYPEMKYLAYFQAYTNTYAPADQLRGLYEAALNYPGVVGLVISTRPDCLGEDVLDLLADISGKSPVFVELGIESFRNETLARINRGHTAEESIEAIRKIAARGLECGAHLILGLPGEEERDFLGMAEILSGLPVHSIKLHQLQIHRGTRMAADYLREPESFRLFGVEEYADLVVRFLERLDPRIYVQRFVSSAPASMVVAPKWGIKNYEFVAYVDRLQQEQDSWQGKMKG